MKRVAIIGAGISGLVLAQALSQKAEIVVFEKARGVGGRMSTRFASPFYFDHGTQYFTARSKEFQNFLKTYFEKGIVAEWKGKVINLEIGKKETKRLWFEPHLVASPNMNSFCKALAEGIDIRTSCEVAPIGQKVAQRFHLHDKDGVVLGDFDWVISTAPPAQTVRLFDPNLVAEHPLRAFSMQGCYALMLGFNHHWDRQWIAAKVQNNPIGWISVNSSKPGRDSKVTCLVAHSSNDWAEAHIDQDILIVQTFLIEQFLKLTGIDAKDADYVSLHRWRYAIVNEIAKIGNYIDESLRLAATSDWCETSRIEAVWFHAQKLAHAIVHDLEASSVAG
jgi:predicted NAD/FAD-dependent oxidoreductase